MTGEDLYREVQCRRCGNTKLKSASFCPHCGHIQDEHWWDRIMDGLRSESSGKGRPTRIAVVSTLIGVAIAAFFLYNAIQKESLQSLILAILTLVFAFRSWFATRNRTEEAGEDVSVSAEPEDFDMVEGHVYCDNCGERVDPDATECPKCGMKFG